MGIRFHCPAGHKLNVKSFLAGKKGICPHCGSKFIIPLESDGVAQSTDSPADAGATGDHGAADHPVEASPAAAVGATPAAAVPAAAAPAPAAPVAAAVPIQATPVQDAPAQAAAGQAAPVQPAPVQPASVQPASAQAVPAQAVPAEWAPAQPQVPAPQASPFGVAPATQPVDPIDQSPGAVWYVRPQSGGQYGPAPGDVMRGWIADGRVAAESLVWCEGWPDWRPAQEVFSQLQTAPAATPAESVTAAPPGDALELGQTAPATPRRTVRRKSNQLTTIFVVLLALLAVALMVIFGIVLGRQGSSSSNIAVPPAALAAASPPAGPARLF